MELLLAALILLVVYVAYAHMMYAKHVALLENIPIRIHVNGIRGKSSVTRLISASLREGRIKTLAKTTGTDARVITSHKRESRIDRKEADIAEQRRILNRYISTNPSKYGAIVFECMAINPIYQAYLEKKIMNSTIGVITNIREDHTDLLGKTLPEIAKSLSSTIPENGHLVTAETNEELIAILRNICKERNTTIHTIAKMRIGRKHMSGFNHFEYDSNVAIAIKVAQLCGISRSTAIQGMHKAIPDPGAFRLKKLVRKNCTIYWANLFAVNDRESFVITTKQLQSIIKNEKTAIILNNRFDRPERVSQFVDICVNSVQADYIITFGDYEAQVKKELAKYQSQKTIHVSMGNSTMYRDKTGRSLLSAIENTIDEQQVLLLGAVNIHTEQASRLLKTINNVGSYV